MKFPFLLLLVPTLALGQAFTFQDIPFLSQQSTDWARRVVLNGGAMPSGNTIQAMENLRKGCIAAGLTNKIDAMCVFVPDSLIAATTPLFLHLGYPMWTNTSFVIGDLNVNGLKGDGIAKALNSGVKAKDALDPANPPRGMAVIVTESSSNAVNVVIGQQEGAGSTAFFMSVSTLGDTEWIASALNASLLTDTPDWGRVGFVSCQVTTNVTTNITVYVASPLESHKVLTNRETPGNLSWTEAATDDTISIFARKRDGTNDNWAPQRLSLAVITKGFSQTESSNFWVLARTCREQLGGGTGDPIHDYNRKIVAAGGAAISTTTSNALRTFYAGLDADGILTNMIVVNPYVPDNLVAVRTPVIWQAGDEIWGNVNFGTTNLTVNGLTGNLTDKHLSIGARINTITVRSGFSDTSAGMSQLIYASNLGDGSYVEMGVAGSAANVFMLLQSFRGNLAFYCWGISTVNANFVTRNTSPLTTNWVGYLSGNRTAGNAIRLDWVNGGGGTHAVFTNGTGAQSLNNDTITNLAAHAQFTLASVANAWSDRTVSYLSVHNGLTQTQSSNQWIRAKNLRTDLGGGLPP